jgi:hypothetical protein
MRRMEDFAAIPAEITRLLERHDRVALVLLDAFGLRFLERHADHPLVRRLEVAPLPSQFPSTTTAHVTTVHFGVPVREHGLYEWNVYEPSLDRVIVPLALSFAGDETPGTLLAAGFDLTRLAPGPTVYRRLAEQGIASAAFVPDRIAGSPFAAIGLEAATQHGFADVEAGARLVAAALAEPGGPRYAHLYWDEIDTAGHAHGPSSEAFAQASLRALDALHDAFFGRDAPAFGDALLVLTADHGQVDVSPDRVDYADDLWPELRDHLAPLHPAGSARDLFLHVRDGHAEAVVDGLTRVLGDRAEVRLAADLFPGAGPRLTARLADVCVLPAEGRMAWLRSAPGVERRFRGHHGGLDPRETATYLATAELS